MTTEKKASAKVATKTKAKAAKAEGGMKLMGSSAEITRAIASIQKRGQSFAKDVHIAACSILAHIEAHGDVTLATRLVDALPDLARKNPLRDWFLHFGKVAWDEENKHFVYARDKVTLLADAQKMPFWQFKAEQAYVPFDLHKALQAILSRAERARKKGEKLPEEQLQRLRLIDASLTGEHVAVVPVTDGIGTQTNSNGDLEKIAA